MKKNVACKTLGFLKTMCHSVGLENSRLPTCTKNFCLSSLSRVMATDIHDMKTFVYLSYTREYGIHICIYAKMYQEIYRCNSESVNVAKTRRGRPR